jgi:hypothetical protein
MNRPSRTARLVLASALAAVLVLAVAALAWAGAPVQGKGKGKGASPSASQYQYGPAGKQYGKTKATICHKGKTIKVGAPAVKAHLRHGDRVGSC